MINIAQKLKTTIDSARPTLRAISDVQAGQKPYSDKWSLKEVLGHLIDSAANNHQRIVRMQQCPDIGKFGYAQDRWVSIQDFASEPWAELIEFWYLYNAHLAHVIAHVDPLALPNVCEMGYGKPASLKFVIEDYLRHVEHHIGQILGDANARERARWVSRTPD